VSDPGQLEQTPIRFLLNGKPCSAPASMARTSLLVYLREVAGLRGAKDGCSEGGCGACMIAVRDRKQENFRAINACIALLGSMDGRSIVTIEGLNESTTSRDPRHDDEAPEDLHEVPRTMLEAAASQCGFCTPGMVISLFCLFSSSAQPNDDEIHYALAGNLCRCTGYGPILEAARMLRASGYRSDADDGFTEPTRAHGLSVPGFQSPQTLEELDEYLAASPEAKLLAGGTGIPPIALTGQGYDSPLIYLGCIQDLRGLEEGPDYLEIGAMVPLARALHAIADEYASLTEVFRRFASLPINNAATLGGNLTLDSGPGDSIPILTALEATIRLRRHGEVRSIPIEELYSDHGGTTLKAGEVIVAIRVSKCAENQQVRAYKVAKRFEQAATAVLGAFNLYLDNGEITAARVSYLGMGKTPERARNVELELLGKPMKSLDIEFADRAIDAEFGPATDDDSDGEYRRLVARNLIVKLGADVSGRELVSLWRETA